MASGTAKLEEVREVAAFILVLAIISCGSGASGKCCDKRPHFFWPTLTNYFSSMQRPSIPQYGLVREGAQLNFSSSKL